MLRGLMLRKYNIELRENWAAENYSGPSANVPKLRNSCWRACNGPCGYLKYGVTKDAFIAWQRCEQVLWLVCLSVCLSLREDISETTCTIFTKHLVRSGSIFIRRRGRSLLSTIALFVLLCLALTKNFDRTWFSDVVIFTVLSHP